MTWNGFSTNDYEDTDPTAFRAAVTRQKERAEALRSRLGPDVDRADAMGDQAWKAKVVAYRAALATYITDKLDVLATWPGNGPVPIIPPMPEY